MARKIYKVSQSTMQLPGNAAFATRYLTTCPRVCSVVPSVRTNTLLVFML